MSPVISRRAFTAGMMATIGLCGVGHARQDLLIAPDVLCSDFDELYERLARVHFDLFAHRSRAEHDALHAALRERMTRSMPVDEAIRLFQRFVAFGRVAHSRIDAASDAYRAFRQAGGPAFPLTLRVRDDRVFIMTNASDQSELAPGDEVLSIEGERATTFIDGLWSDLSADTRYMFHSMIEWELPRLIWQRLGAVPAIRLKISRYGEDGREVLVRTRTRAEMGAATSQIPLLDPAASDRTWRLIDDAIGYFRPGPFYAAENPDAMYDNTAFVGLVDRAFSDLIDKGAGKVIIDLRDNPGGDNSFSDHLVSWFADRPFRFASAFRIKVTPETVASNAARLSVAGNDPTGISAKLAEAYGRARAGEIIDFPIPIAQPRAGHRYSGEVFVLVNRHSYSNTVSVASLIQDYGFGTILGEETSDLATTYGAMESFTLSRTGIVVGYPKARIVRISGDLTGRGVVPDVSIETPVVETPDDPVLQRAISLVRSSTSAGPSK
ncbi:S41 family peptidase [Erythrobacter donghaensis]|uniref:S41 family peptidase n=1 Tax=Erythrobacter donghaensis TaxID=267135 RepID=UPI000A833174|nr:S41 family peptidase [Erythrobacter donghaensis]